MTDKKQTPPTTTDAGIRVQSDEHSLTVGPDGPIVLNDAYLLEQMANFNRDDAGRVEIHDGEYLPARCEMRCGDAVLYRGGGTRQP